MSPKHYSTYKVARTTALAKHLEVSTTSALLAKGWGRIDSTAPSDDYWVMFMSNSSLPSDGAGTVLITLQKQTHITGTDSTFSFDFSPDYIKSTDGLFVVLSTDEFQKQIVTSDVFSCTVLYKTGVIRS